MDLYLPKRYDKSMMSHFGYIQNLPYVDLASPLLQVSIDTLCLAEIGSLYEDERCLQECRERYTRALPMLSNELGKPASKQMRKDHVLTAITILALCELFDAIAKGNPGSQGWISHVNGAQQYIRASGPDAISTPFGWLLFHNIRHSSLCMGFSQRKALFFAEPKWLALTTELGQADPYVALYDVVVQVPGVLERADSLSTAESIPADFSGLCRDICQLRSDLEGWKEEKHVDVGREIHRIIDVRDMKEFAHMCLDRTFQTVFDFDSVNICSQFQLYWTSLLLLDFTLLSICRRFQVSEPFPRLQLEDFTTRTEEDIERDLFVSATSYCRSIPFCCEPESASIGRIGTFLLRITQSYFEQCGHCKELEWCKNVQSMLGGPDPTQKTSRRTPSVGPLRSSAPWDAKKQRNCKSPICNFQVECCAPAPLLLSGEYPNTTNVPANHPCPLVANMSSPRERSTDDAELRVTAAPDNVLAPHEIATPSASTIAKQANALWLKHRGSLGKTGSISTIADDLIVRTDYDTQTQIPDWSTAYHTPASPIDLAHDSPAYSRPRTLVALHV